MTNVLGVTAAEAAANGLGIYAWPPVGRARVLMLAPDRRTALRAARRFVGAPAGGWRQRVRTLSLSDVAPLRRLPMPTVSDSLLRRLRQLVPDTAQLAVRAGVARANRKPVVLLLDETGTPLAVAKIGGSDLTRRLVRAEHTNLTELAAGDLSERLDFPRVLGLVDEPCTLVLGYLDVERSRPLTAEESATAARAIAATAFGPATPVADAPVVRRAIDSLSASGDSAAPRLRDAAAVALDKWNNPVPTGAWHGDWTEHNTGHASGRVLVWDWERYETGVPLGFDELHRAFTARTGGEPSMQDVTQLLDDCPAILEGFGVDVVSAPGVCLAYLVTIASRYVVDGQRQWRPRLGAVEDWLLPVMSEPLPAVAPPEDRGASR